MKRPPDPPPAEPRPSLTGFLVVMALFFALPAALLFRLVDTTGSTRVAVQILALTLPATGALVLRLNPDLVPARAVLEDLSPLEWVRVLLLTGLLLGGAWWTATLVHPS